MNDHNEFYLRYKRNRKRDVPGEQHIQELDMESEKSPTDEVDELYKMYRQNRKPDFDESIATIMQHARDKVDAEKAIENVMESVRERASVKSGEHNSKPGLFATLLHAPGRVLERIVSVFSTGGSPNWVFSTGGSPNWASAAIPAVAVVAIVTSVVMYTSGRQIGNEFELAVNSEQAAIAMAEYIEPTGGSPLGFGGTSGANEQAFSLGVASVDMQIASIAKRSELVRQSIDRMQNLLSPEKNSTQKARLEAYVEESDFGYSETKPVIKELAESLGTSENWFEFGRAVQLVNFSSQLALQQEASDTVRASIDEFVSQFEKMDKEDLTDPEINASNNIISLVNNDDITVDELRILRDSARDIKAMRR